jgi:hypothetical protein
MSPPDTQLIPIFGTLLAVIVGGLLTFLTTSVIERQRWKRERRDKLDEIRRDAYAAALEWIDPMRNAELKASSMVMAALQGELDHERFMNEYPYLVGDLAKSDLTGSQRASLPVDFYSCGHKIIRDLDKLRYLGVKYGQEVQVGRTIPEGYEECMAKMNEISNDIEHLERELKAAFHKTFQLASNMKLKLTKEPVAPITGPIGVLEPLGSSTWCSPHNEREKQWQPIHIWCKRP